MLVSAIIYLLTFIANIFIAILPSSTFWPLPEGLTDGLAWLGEQIGLAGAFLPDGVLSNMTSALTLIVTVNLFILPWLAARNFRLPFAAMTKGEKS